MSEQLQKVGDMYEFDCPIHGTEVNVFCWRAFRLEFNNRWSLYCMVYQRPLTAGEVEQWRKDRGTMLIAP